MLHPHSRLRTLLLVLILPLLAPSFSPCSQALANSLAGTSEEPIARVEALERMTNTPGPEALERFLKRHVSPAYVESAGREELLATLADIREHCGNAGGISVEPVGEGQLLIEFESAAGLWNVELDLGDAPEHLVSGLYLSRGEARKSLEPFHWNDFEQRLEEYEAQGFRGSVLIVRGGEVLHSRGYGFANENLGARNTPQTIFAIGSIPIDFTKAAILLLEQRGKLHTGDLLSKHLKGVPEDKLGMTLEHLMQGSSGLANFHGIRGVDEDLDLSYIDREEALRRIFSKPLLFKPGTRREHSHSAWGVLAAVVEEVSGQSYGEFLQTQFFKPMGIKRTGLYPHSAGFEEAQIAVGVGPPALGKPNTPRNWGETSWLVMGSGGMVSTTEDLYRWVSELRAERVLSAESLEKYWSAGPLGGSNDRGFCTLYTEGPGQLMVMCSNSLDGLDALAPKVGDELARMVQTPWAAPYYFGLAVAFDTGAAEVREVVAGSPAEAAGARVGDVIVRVNGEHADAAYERVVRAAAQDGAAVELEVARGGGTIVLRVKPRRRAGGE